MELRIKFKLHRVAGFSHRPHSVRAAVCLSHPLSSAPSAAAAPPLPASEPAGPRVLCKAPRTLSHSCLHTLVSDLSLQRPPRAFLTAIPLKFLYSTNPFYSSRPSRELAMRHMKRNASLSMYFPQGRCFWRVGPLFLHLALCLALQMERETVHHRGPHPWDLTDQRLKKGPQTRVHKDRPYLRLLSNTCRK